MVISQVMSPQTSCLLLGALLLLCGPKPQHCCYSCMTTSEVRESLCQYLQASGKLETPEACAEDFRRGFEPLKRLVIPSEQTSWIEEYLEQFDREVRQIDILLPPELWNQVLEKKIAKYVSSVKDIVSRNQKNARTFNCSECEFVDCNLPVECGMEDINVQENDWTVMSCNVTFTLPENYQVEWLFAEKIRVTDLSHFTVIHSGDSNDLLFIIEGTLSARRGSYACEIQDYAEDILVRKFFFLNAPQPSITLPFPVSSDTDTRALELERFLTKVFQSNKTDWQYGRKEEEEDNGFDIVGFLFYRKPVGEKALIILTVTVALIFMLATCICLSLCFYAYEDDFYSYTRIPAVETWADPEWFYQMSPPSGRQPKRQHTHQL
ncbi:sperm acrosome membrane-associated protein 6 isoform X3 [Hyperolius riggenbachi]|uniref:sperm acrosome membrane-associated protein 6 isoform X3 n=1 Tax=Hyperolius riggenbachi TaxID=752182 RepID=UPI0035A3C202